MKDRLENLDQVLVASMASLEQQLMAYDFSNQIFSKLRYSEDRDRYLTPSENKALGSTPCPPSKSEYGSLVKRP